MIVFYKAINILFDIIEVFIFIRIFLSFLPIDYRSGFSRFIYDVTDPILGPCSMILERLGIDTGFLDFSPLLALLFMNLIIYILKIIIF